MAILSSFLRMLLVVLLDHLLDFLHRREGNGFLGAEILTSAATDNAIKGLHHPGTIFLLVPLKNAIFAEVEAFPTADTLIFINRGVPGNIFTGDLEHFLLLIFGKDFLAGEREIFPLPTQ